MRLASGMFNPTVDEKLKLRRGNCGNQIAADYVAPCFMVSPKIVPLTVKDTGINAFENEEFCLRLVF